MLVNDNNQLVFILGAYSESCCNPNILKLMVVNSSYIAMVQTFSSAMPPLAPRLTSDVDCLTN